MSYWYHMAGASMGDLYVQYENNGQWVTFDSILGQQQTNETDPWLERKVSIPARGNTKIRFKGIRGSSFDGDMAIDDVKFFRFGTESYSSPKQRLRSFCQRYGRNSRE
jgi:hypothetical protein